MNRVTEQNKAIAKQLLSEVTRGKLLRVVKFDIRARVARFPAIGETFLPVTAMRNRGAIQRVLEHIATTGSLPPIHATPHQSNARLLTSDKDRAKLLEKVTTEYTYDPVNGLLYRKGKGKLGNEIAVYTDANGSRYVCVNGRRYSAALICWIAFYGQLPARPVAVRRGAPTLAIKYIYTKD